MLFNFLNYAHLISILVIHFCMASGAMRSFARFDLLLSNQFNFQGFPSYLHHFTNKKLMFQERLFLAVLVLWSELTVLLCFAFLFCLRIVLKIMKDMVVFIPTTESEEEM